MKHENRYMLATKTAEEDKKENLKQKEEKK